MTADLETRLRRVRKVTGAAVGLCGLAGIASVLSVPQGSLGSTGFAVGVLVSAILIGAGLVQVLVPRPYKVIEIAAICVLFVATIASMLFTDWLDERACLGVRPNVTGCLNPALGAVGFAMWMLSFVVLLMAVFMAIFPAMLRKGMLTPRAVAVGSELEKLRRLHGEGVLTDEEFALAKRRLLGDRSVAG